MREPKSVLPTAKKQADLQKLATLLRECTFIEFERAKKKWRISDEELVAFRDPETRTVLHYLARNANDLAILEYFLCVVKMSPNVFQSKGLTNLRPLQVAGLEKNIGAIKLLVTHGAEISFVRKDGRKFDLLNYLSVCLGIVLPQELVLFIQNAANRIQPKLLDIDGSGTLLTKRANKTVINARESSDEQTPLLRFVQ